MSNDSGIYPEMDSSSSSPDYSDQQTWLRSLGISPPRFPSFQEMVEADLAAQGTPAARPKQGLFEQLLGDPRVLYDAWLARPDDFDPRLGEILMALLMGQSNLQTLLPGDLALLDAATLDFAQNRPRKAPAPPPPPKPRPELEDDQEPDLEWTERGRQGAPLALPVLPDIQATPTRWWEHR